MSLKQIKSELNVNQKNILLGHVIAVTQSVARVRLADGQVIRAAEGGSYQAGDQVQLHTDGKTYTVSGKARIAELDGAIICMV